MNIQHWFPLELTGLISLQSKGLSKSLLQHHNLKASIIWHSAFFMVQLSHPYMTTGKNIALTRWAFAGKVMSLLFNMLSRLVITFLPRHISGVCNIQAHSRCSSKCSHSCSHWWADCTSPSPGPRTSPSPGPTSGLSSPLNLTVIWFLLLSSFQNQIKTHVLGETLLSSPYLISCLAV